MFDVFVVGFSFVWGCSCLGLGKILQDAQTVESYKIEEKGFIVCMVQKVRRTTLECFAQFLT